MGLDSVINGDEFLKIKERVHSFVYQPQALIIARLAGNPNFEELAIKLKTSGRWGINEEVMEAEYPKLVDYLRNHVQPL